MRAIYIFWYRQVIKYLRTPARVFGSLGQPLLYLVALGVGLSPVVPEVGGVSYINYLTPGIIGLTVLFTAVFTGIELVSDRRFGFLKETLVAPVSRIWIYLGKSLGGATISTIQGLLVLGLSFLFGFKLMSFGGFLLGLLVMFLVSLLFTMVGLLVATFIRDFQTFPIIINFLILPLFFLSGAIFPLTNIPTSLKIITSINPLTYGIDLLRGFLSGGSFYSHSLSFAVLFGLLVSFLFIGVKRFNKMTV
ncbi:MAG: ABC transporter permease [Candidatus Paceibacterota bacterium]